jgi:hypothetical protein
MGNESSGRLTQFSNSKVAMMFLVATMVCDHCVAVSQQISEMLPQAANRS